MHPWASPTLNAANPARTSSTLATGEVACGSMASPVCQVGMGRRNTQTSRPPIIHASSSHCGGRSEVQQRVREVCGRIDDHARHGPPAAERQSRVQRLPERSPLLAEILDDLASLLVADLN